MLANVIESVVCCRECVWRRKETPEDDRDEEWKSGNCGKQEEMKELERSRPSLEGILGPLVGERESQRLNARCPKVGKQAYVGESGKITEERVV